MRGLEWKSILTAAIAGSSLFIAAGAPGFAKYVHFSRPLATWRLRVV